MIGFIALFIIFIITDLPPSNSYLSSSLLLGLDPTNAMHALHSAHKAENSQNFGFSLDTEGPVDSVSVDVYDLYATKLNALRLAVDAALTVLKVDQIVMSKPAGGPKPRQGGPGDE